MRVFLAPSPISLYRCATSYRRHLSASGLCPGHPTEDLSPRFGKIASMTSFNTCTSCLCASVGPWLALCPHLCKKQSDSDKGRKSVLRHQLSCHAPLRCADGHWRDAASGHGLESIRQKGQIGGGTSPVPKSSLSPSRESGSKDREVSALCFLVTNYSLGCVSPK